MARQQRHRGAFVAEDHVTAKDGKKYNYMENTKP